MDRAVKFLDETLVWLQATRGAIAAAFGGLLLASCSGSLGDIYCIECQVADGEFYAQTSLTVDPNNAVLIEGQTVEADVILIYPRSFNTGRNQFGNPRHYELNNVSVVTPVAAGLTATLAPVNIGRACTAAEIPASLDPSRTDFQCGLYRLSVTATGNATVPRAVVVSAQWEGDFLISLDPNAPPEARRVIERIAELTVGFPVAPPPPTAPDFQIAVEAVPGGVYATQATLPISIARVGGFAEAVTLEYSPLASGIGGAFAAEPSPTDRRSLVLQIPARYAGGGRVDLRVTATAASGRTKTLDFTQFIDPLFRLEVQPADASLTSAAPLSVDVGLTPGAPFRTTSLGVVDLSFSTLPPGVEATFLDDAAPVGPVLPTLKVWRRLRLVTNGAAGVMGPLTITGTARGVPPDIFGVVPFVETTLNLTVVEGQSWQFVGNNLTYGTDDADVIGIALQSDDRPAIAWLGGLNPKRVYLRRFDGTTFASSPPRVNLGFGLVAPSLSVPGSSIAEASFALTATDAGQVAFTYDGGARLALGRVGRADVEWRVAPPHVVGDPADPATTRARSPRVATGPADAVMVSYIREANASTTTGGVLHVLRSSGNGVLSPLPTSLPGGALNASPVGSIVRHATALALRADGNPWVAWIEQPTNPAIPNRLWLRAYDGNDWGPAIVVPTPGAPVGASVQLLVEPSGMVVVAWLEGSPAQLKLARYDPSSQTWTPLDNTGNGRGSLNVTASSPALDVHLARHPDGRLLATWTEGGAEPRVWIKRRDAAGVWRLLGTSVSQVDRISKTPRIVSDANSRLYVAWAQYAFGRGPDVPLPYAEIDVAQWIFP